MGLIESCRLDQARAMAAWDESFRVHRHVLNVQPTGTGKTHTSAAYMLMRMQVGLSTLFVVHRDILAVQTFDRLQRDGLEPGMFTGTSKTKLDSKVVVCSIQTLQRRHGANPDFLHSFDLIIVDEAHRGEMDKVFLLKKPEQKVLGQTASPLRGYGNGLGRFYQHMNIALSYTESLDIKAVVPPRIYAPVVPDMKGVKVTRNAEGEEDFKAQGAAAAMGRVTKSGLAFWRKNFAHLRTLGFCVNVVHALDVEAQLKHDGVKCRVITGATPKSLRNLYLQELEESQIQVILNVGVFVEGYDAKCIECVLLMNPTKSLAKLLQSAGRGSRTAPGKDFYVLVDCAGSVWTHGSPGIDREWSLEHGCMAAKTVNPYRTCKTCFAFYLGNACPLCGAIPPVVERPVKTQAGDMVVVPADLQAPSDPKAEPDDDFGLAGEKIEMSVLHATRRKLYATAPRGPNVQDWVRRKMAARILVDIEGRKVIIPEMPSMLW